MVFVGSMRVSATSRLGGAIARRSSRAVYATGARTPPCVARRGSPLLNASGTGAARCGGDVRTLRRHASKLATQRGDTTWEARVVQPSLDGRDTLVLEVRTDLRRVSATPNVHSIVLRARTGAPLVFSVRIATTGATLTPIARTDIFTPDFLAFLAAARAGAAGDSAAIRARWLERHVRGVELLASREKLMAGLPTYGTYFGRDMLVSALMMRPIWARCDVRIRDRERAAKAVAHMPSEPRRSVRRPGGARERQ